jgi:hypothetical protein
MPATLFPASLTKCAQEDGIPYSREAVRQDLARVRVAWQDAQSSRDRNAIYKYLTAVYSLVTWWAAEGQDVIRARRAVRLSGLEVCYREDAFAAIIRCSAHAARVDKRSRSKWSRVMRYAAAYKTDSEPLVQFIRRKGGINECVARYGRWLRRRAKKRVFL